MELVKVTKMAGVSIALLRLTVRVQLTPGPQMKKKKTAAGVSGTLGIRH